MFNKVGIAPVLVRSAIAAAVLCTVGAAQAVVITFEDPVSASALAPLVPFFGPNNEFYQAGMWIDTFSQVMGAQPTDLVGAMVDGSDLAATCVSATCPSNNATKFYTALNDGYIAFGSLATSATIRVSTFQAAFVAASGDTVPTIPAILVLQGVRTDGTYMNQLFNLTGAASNGALSFATFTTSGTFATTAFSYVFAYAAACPVGGGNCSPFTTDKAQFAIDNINVSVSAVPEPGTWALMGMGLGLAAIGALRRRPV